MTAVHTRCSLLESCLLFTLLISSVGLVQCEDDIITTFFSNYDKTLRPGFGQGSATIVTVDLEIESFGNIEEANMEYKVFAYFRQIWIDTRLAGKLNYTLVINGKDLESMWVPDPYCYNARESNMMLPDTTLHSSASIGTDGSVLYSKGITLLASCNMDLQHFPLDSQCCFLKFGSYSYTSKSIVFKWKGKDVNVGNKEMAQFEFKGTKLTSGEDVFSTGNYSTITATFSFKRRTGYYLIQVYFPDIFVVVFSWCVFWMNKDDMANRMVLGITTILSIMFLLGSLNGTLPKVSYPKALDWYLLVSFAFVFLSLVECMAVFLFTLSANKEKEKRKNKFKDVPWPSKILICRSIKAALGTSSKNDKKSPTNHSHCNGVTNAGTEYDPEITVRACAPEANGAVVDDGAFEFFAGRNKKEKIAEAIDKVSRALFPLSFVVYNIFYWNYYYQRGLSSGNSD